MMIHEYIRTLRELEGERGGAIVSERGWTPVMDLLMPVLACARTIRAQVSGDSLILYVSGHTAGIGSMNLTMRDGKPYLAMYMETVFQYAQLMYETCEWEALLP